MLGSFVTASTHLFDYKVEVVKVYERNARAFDISKPLDALNFVTFLGFVCTEHARRLKEEFEKVKESFLRRYKEGDETLQWTMDHQFPKAKDAKRKSATASA